MRTPDLIIGNPPQTLRWHLFQFFGIQVALHKWLKSDDDRALHDHSADNISIILSPQGYWEVIGSADGMVQMTVHRRAWIPYFRKAEQPHRVLLWNKQPTWSIWIRFKPRREWGFHCPKGWRPWKQYVAERDIYKVGDSAKGVSTVGRGCD